MKTLGLLLVIAGVAIGAASGARNTPELMNRQRIEGRGTILDQRCRTTLDAYHQRAGKIAKEALSKHDTCPGGIQKNAAQKAQNARVRSSRKVLVRRSHAELARRRHALIASAEARLEHLRAYTPAGLSSDAIRARTSWLDAFGAAIAPVATAATLGAPASGPVARLRQWLHMAGLPFALGLFLVILGALVSRVAVGRERREERAGRTAGGKPRALDFGHVLAALVTEADGIARDLAAATMVDDDDFVHMRERIEAAQFDKVDRLVEARLALQGRLGLAGFADVFSPLSFGERNFNRTWTALVDSHWAEASRASKIALHGFTEAAAKFTELTAA